MHLELYNRNHSYRIRIFFEYDVGCYPFLELRFPTNGKRKRTSSQLQRGGYLYQAAARAVSLEAIRDSTMIEGLENEFSEQLIYH